MSAMTISPQFSSDMPVFVSMNVTVMSGLIVRSVPNPEGTSTETIVLPDARASDMNVLYGSRTLPPTPVPSAQSTMTSASFRSVPEYCSMGHSRSE